MAIPTKNISFFEDNPEFFKVFMPCFTLKNMWIPPAFARNLFRNFPKTATLKCETGGSRSWPVRVEKIEDKLCFTSGWERFVRGNSLERGDFLLFKLVSDSSFEVKIYEINGCKKSTKAKTGLASDEGKDKSEIRLVAKNLKRKSAPTPQNIASSSSSEKVREKAKAKFTANQNRFFMTTHTTANSRKYVVSFPRWVVEGIRIEEEIVLRSRNGQLWPVGTLARQDGRHMICSGWVRFVEKNHVKPQDKCMFELVVDETNTCREIRVDVIRGDA